MQVELKRIQREAGITTIIVTHDQEEALSLSDRVAVMSEGRIAETGDFATGAGVHLGIRPESSAMLPVAEGDGACANTTLGRVAESVYKGSHVELYVQGPDGMRIIVQQRGEALAGAAPEIGQDVALTIAPDAIVVFE